MNDDLPLSGERVIEDYKSSPGTYAIYLMHVASYEFAKRYAAGKRVLDLGCGSGYGAAMIAEVAKEVVGVDVSSEAVSYAAGRYCTENLRFRCISSGQPLPFPERSFDVVLSFQVIEHIVADDAYVEEARRLLADDGTLIMITPNRSVRLFSGQRPWNRWHVREYDSSTLLKLLNDEDYETSMLFMTAQGEIAALELSRYRRMKWITWPFTLSWIPDAWRVHALNLLHMLSDAGKQPGRTNAPHDFSIRDISIGEEADCALNLVAISRRKRSHESAL